MSKSIGKMTRLGSSCGACKFLRRKCTSECVFAPYFCYDQAANHFAAVHKVFGASNFSKLLSRLPLQSRSQAAITVSYEALARVRDPVHGCVSHIYALQQQVACLQEEIGILGNQMGYLSSDVSTSGSSQVTNNQYSYLQFSFPDNLEREDYLNEGAPQLSITPNTSANQAFYSQLNVQLPPGCEHEDLISHSSFDTNFTNELSAELNREIFQYYPWIGNGSTV